jgi:hypothetical protein
MEHHTVASLRSEVLTGPGLVGGLRREVVGLVKRLR